MLAETPLTVEVADGPRLEARLALPIEPSAGVVLCHPHPLWGGDMDSTVVTAAAAACQRAGLATLRFNFRGTGVSEGTHDGGQAERLDVAAALAALRARVAAGRPVGLLGYSFGARVAAEAPLAGVAALCLVAPPLTGGNLTPSEPVPAHVWLVIGARDPYCPEAAAEVLARRLAAHLVRVEGADHFFDGEIHTLAGTITSWVAAWARR